MGRHNYKLVGQYVQLSMIFYVVCYIPFIILWWVYMPNLLLWLGFDAQTAEIGKEYTQVRVVYSMCAFVLASYSYPERCLGCGTRSIFSWNFSMVSTNPYTDYWTS